jgi:hypothetical protein
MKNKWLWITLSVVLVLVLLAGTAFIFLRIGMMRSVATVTTGTAPLTEGCCELSESGEGPILGAIPGTTYGYRGMMGQYFDRFDRFSNGSRFNMMGGRVSMFSPLRWLGGLVLLGMLVLLVILIVKALTGKTKLIVKTQPEVVEVPPVEPTEQQ